jgi:hypothetical protein
MKYTPLIQLESSSVDISDSTQRSFIINLNLVYQIQMPRWLCYEEHPGYIKQINVDFTRLGYEPITTHSMRSLINRTYPDPYGNTKNVIRRNILISSLEELDLSEMTGNSDEKNYTIRIHLGDEIFKFDHDCKFNFFDIYNKFHHDIKPSLIDTTENEVRFIFGEEQYQLFNATDINPIIIQIVQFFPEHTTEEIID